jgi:hypothetical protein
MNELTECGAPIDAGNGGDCFVSHAYQAFASAWKTACSLDNPVFLVPAGRRYKVGAIQFLGPCKDNRMIIQVISVALLQFKDRRIACIVM